MPFVGIGAPRPALEPTSITLPLRGAGTSVRVSTHPGTRYLLYLAVGRAAARVDATQDTLPSATSSDRSPQARKAAKGTVRRKPCRVELVVTNGNSTRGGFINANVRRRMGDGRRLRH